MAMQKLRQRGEAGMATDLDIARAATLKPIAEIATRAGIPTDALEPYGKYKAKIGLDFIRAQADRPGCAPHFLAPRDRHE
jgi:hypothetical protein